MEIENKIAVVTGGASGIGKSTVLSLISAGAKVAIFDLNEEMGKALVSNYPDSTIYASVNVSDEHSVQQGIDQTLKAFGAIHICINCAGIHKPSRTLSRRGPHSLASWQQTIDINLNGTFNVIRLCVEQMAKNQPLTNDGGRGVIVNTASVAAFEGQVGQAAYSASKAGVVGMTLPIARDLAEIGIRINTVVPGLINTAMFEAITPEIYQTLSDSVLYPKRLGTPEEISHVVKFLIENDYINGESIRMDGGIRMQPS